MNPAPQLPHRMTDRDLLAWLKREVAWHREMLAAHESVASSQNWQKATGEVMATARRALIRELETARSRVEDKLAEAAL